VVVRVLPDKRNGPGAGRPELVQDERLAGGRSAVIFAHPADEFRDLACDLVAKITALYDRAGYCDCGDDHCNLDEVCQELVHLAEDAQHRMWVAELDGGRRG
jgi:hypothetical protein